MSSMWGKNSCKKRLFALLLATSLVSGTAMPVFASENSDHTAGMEAADSQSESEAGIAEENEDEYLLPDTSIGEDEDVKETIPELPEEKNPDVDGEYMDASDDSASTEEFPEEGETLAPIAVNIRESCGEDDSEELFAGYVDRLFGWNGNAASPDSLKKTKKSVGSKFEGASQKLYSDLIAGAQEIAAGHRESAEFVFSAEDLGYGDNISWSASELGVSAVVDGGSITQEALDSAQDKFEEELQADKVIKALLADFPYEYYWHDKTIGTDRQVNVGAVYGDGEWRCCIVGDYTISFSVSDEFAVSQYTADTEKTGAASLAVENAQAILTAGSELSDLDKLYYYKNAICEKVSYNDTVEEGAAYGNPWQMIWVFDNDDSTNVVCEGYTKAFQYLCDKTEFSGDSICAYSVSGTMSKGTDGEDHMWNIVTLEDGNNYLTDVTNSDSGAIGENEELFLVPSASGSVENGYVFSGGENSEISYVYDEDTLELFTREELTIASAAAETDPLEILVQPESVHASINELVVLHVEANLDQVSYQWQWSAEGSSWRNCSSAGSDTDTFSFRMKEILSGRSYRCAVEYKGLKVYSNPAVITLKAGLVEITVHPHDTSAFAGETVSLHVETNIDNVTYQWQWSTDGNSWRNCTSAGYNTDTFSFLMKTALAGRYYRCNVSAGSTIVSSNTALITLEDSAFEIIVHPENVNAEAGEAVNLHVEANRSDVAYQWQWSMDQENWKNCTSTGFNTDTFSFLMKDALDQRKYRCKVSRGSAFVFSNTITLALKNDVVEPLVVSTGKCGEKLTWTLYDNGLLQISGTGEMASYTASAGSRPWYGLGNGIKEVEIGDGVTSIGTYAFAFEKGLTKVQFGNTVERIGTYAFFADSALEDFELPESLTSIEAAAFDSCSAVTGITIPAGVTYIGNGAFYNDTGVTAFTVEQGNTAYCSEDGVLFTIDKKKLISYPASSAETSYTVPSAVRTISASAFYKAANLETITLDYGLQTIERYAFYGCTGLEEIDIPDTVTTLGTNLFEGCTGLVRAVTGSGITSIPDNMFCNCASLSDLTIRGAIMSIGDVAFGGCSSLPNFEIPATVNRLGTSTFSGCTSFTEMTIGSNVTTYHSGTSLFEGCTSLETVVLENSAVITRKMFKGCSALKNITFTDGTTQIGVEAFSGCRSLEEIRLENITYIGDSAFEGCSALKSATLAEGITSIYEKTFYGCTGLEEVSLPQSLTSIGYCAFARNTSLITVTIPDNVTTIDKYAFLSSNGIRVVYMGAGVESVGEQAFERGITDVYYAGSEADWNQITFGNYNSWLQYATIHYEQE